MQEALAERLAQILPQLGDQVNAVPVRGISAWKRTSTGPNGRCDAYLCSGQTQVALAYFRMFFATMRREWFGIDRLRLDKFMMLVRKFVQQTFVLMRDADW